MAKKLCVISGLHCRLYTVYTVDSTAPHFLNVYPNWQCSLLTINNIHNIHKWRILTSWMKISTALSCSTLNHSSDNHSLTLISHLITIMIVMMMLMMMVVIMIESSYLHLNDVEKCEWNGEMIFLTSKRRGCLWGQVILWSEPRRPPEADYAWSYLCVVSITIAWLISW